MQTRSRLDHPHKSSMANAQTKCTEAKEPIHTQYCNTGAETVRTTLWCQEAGVQRIQNVQIRLDRDPNAGRFGCKIWPDPWLDAGSGEIQIQAGSTKTKKYQAESGAAMLVS